MTLPVLKVEIDFASGPSFSYPLLLNSIPYGILDTNTLGDQPADVVDISSQVLRCSTRRGRNRILSNFEAGTATVTLNDPDSDFNPQNSAGPYYGKLLPLRKIRIYAETTVFSVVQEVNIFSGYITSYDTGFYQGTNETATVILQCVDGFRLLNNVSTGFPPVPGCTAGQLSGARVDELLDFAGFPTSMRATTPGNSTMQVDPGGARSILAAIQTIEQSEFGAFFMQRSGKTLFFDRDSVTKRANVFPKIYTDIPAAGKFPYESIDFAFDDQLILNDVTVTRYDDNVGPDPVPQTVTDAASIAKFFTKSGQRTGILVQSDQEALDQAQTLLVARKDADLRIDSITLNLNADISEANTVVNLSSDIYNLIIAEKQMPGGSSIVKELFIQGVQQDISPSRWIIKLLTAEPLIQGFILDSENNAATGFIGQGYLGENPVTQGTNPLSY
jgi:hypothetical protein